LLTLTYKLFRHSGMTLLMIVRSEGLKMLYQYIQRWFPIMKKKKKVKRSTPLIFEGQNILCFV
jgi:23S rRNA U2552 (ribose-2'-O)-methylase RlmE/FtsJ